MTLSAILHRRLFLGVAALALLAIAGTVTTLATTPSHAQSANDAACAQEDAQPDRQEPAGPDTDTADVQCGDQADTGTDSAEGKDAAGTDNDTLQEGDQTTPDAPGAAAN